MMWQMTDVRVAIAIPLGPLLLLLLLLLSLSLSLSHLLSLLLVLACKQQAHTSAHVYLDSGSRREGAAVPTGGTTPAPYRTGWPNHPPPHHGHHGRLRLKAGAGDRED